MKDLTAVEHKLINDLALAGTKKVDIAEMIKCNPKSVYNSLHRSFPVDGSSKITVRKRSTGAYKGTAQVLAKILEYVLNHRWATNEAIIRDCELPTAEKKTVSRWLAKLGIGSYIACRREGITAVNVQRR